MRLSILRQIHSVSDPFRAKRDGLKREIAEPRDLQCQFVKGIDSFIAVYLSN